MYKRTNVRTYARSFFGGNGGARGRWVWGGEGGGGGWGGGGGGGGLGGKFVFEQESAERVLFREGFYFNTLRAEKRVKPANIVHTTKYLKYFIL